MRLLPFLLLAACNATAIDEFEVCALDIALTPTAGAPGDSITVTGTPFTEVRDTRIAVGGVAAQVKLVKRVDLDNECADRPCSSGADCNDCGAGTTCGLDGLCAPTFNCGLCVQCRLDAGCPPCGECQGLNLEAPERARCFGDPFADPSELGACDLCQEIMIFVVPPIEPGLTAVFVTNRNGQSEAVPFEVLPGPEPTGATGTTADTGTSDTDTTDTGTSDTETGTTETGTTETGTTETGTVDTGTTETGTTETGTIDTAGGSGGTTVTPATGDTGDTTGETASTGDTG